jgi:hypothetical protein
MRASDVNIIPANYLRQENILTIFYSFFQDLHNGLRTSSNLLPWLAFRSIDFAGACGTRHRSTASQQNQDKRPSWERLTVSSQVDISANRSGEQMLKGFFDRLKISLANPEMFLYCDVRI